MGTRLSEVAPVLVPGFLIQSGLKRIGPERRSRGSGESIAPWIRPVGLRSECAITLKIITTFRFIFLGIIDMDQLYAPEIEKARQDRILNVIRVSLGIAWKSIVTALALAIVLGMVAGPTAQSGRSTLEAAQPVRVEKDENCYRVVTQIPPGQDTLQIELIDPPGRKHLKLVYGKHGIVHFYTIQSDSIAAPLPGSLRIGYAVTPEGGEVVNTRTPGAYYSVGLHRSGHSYVLVESTAKERTRLGHIRISPEGEPQPANDDTNAPN